MAKVIIEDKMKGIIKVQNENDSVVFTLKIPHTIGVLHENITTRR